MKLIITILLILSPAIVNAVSIPLTVQEALPAGVSGLNRTSAPVTVGVPLADSDSISSITQLGLSGVSAGQFRALAWWPSGNIKWALADFQADLTAGGTNTGIALTNGSGNFGGSNLATDGSTIYVNTGTATFSIKKANFNIFDVVTVGGTTLVTSGNAGRVSAVGADGTVYTSTNDASSTSVIEENGPVRCVIKSTGSLKSSGGTRLMEYTLRLHFYKGSSKVKAYASMRNANKTNNYAIAFKSAEIIVPLALGTSPTITFARKDDTVSSVLSGTANLQQGHSSYTEYPYVEMDLYNWTPPVPGTSSENSFTYNSAYNGLNVQIGSTSYNSFGTLTDWTQGFATLEDGTKKGVTGVMRYMGGYWPASFEIKDSGEFSIELYGKWTNKTNKLEWGKHDTREVLWDFHTSTSSATSSLYQLQYPAIAKADFAQYANSKAIYGQKEVVDESDQNAAYASIGKMGMSLSNPSFSALYRAWPWGMGGGDNQIDFALGQLTNYLRSGNPGWYLIGEHRGQFIASSGVRHSDDFSTALIEEDTNSDPMPTFNGISGKLMGSDSDEHSHIMVIPFLYYITGNEMYKEDMQDYGEYLWRLNVHYPHFLPYTNYFRVWNRHLKNIALAHEFESSTNTTALSGVSDGANTYSGFGTTNITYSKLVTATLDYILDSRDLPGSGSTNVDTRGRNLDRGYLYWDSTLSPDGTTRALHSFFHTQIHFETMWQVWRIINDTNMPYLRKTELEDYMTGMSRFFYDEFIQYDSASTTNKYAFAYDYYLDVIPPTDMTISDASRAATWAFQHTGNAEYLAKGLWTSWESNQPGFTPGIQAELQDQSLLWTILNQSSVATWQSITPSVTSNGGGSYTISLTVPTGATKYQIKYSDKPIVEWLGFDKTTRAYQYDPASYTAFFAANNITSNPTPATPGTVQTVTLTGLPTGQVLSAKYYTGDSPVPGSCGASNGLALSSAPVTGLCSAGTPSAVTGTGPWAWTCAGSGGGSTASCGATLLEVPPEGNAYAVVACPVIAGFR